MAATKESLVERVQESYRRLAVSAANLNSVSDTLGTSISALEVSLKKLGLGIFSWFPFIKSTSPDGLSYYSEQIGYTKINGRWGLAIKTVSGHEAHDQDDVESWPFNEAPRHLRVRAVRAIPDLLDQLEKDAAKISQEVIGGIEQVDTLTTAIDTAMPPKPAESRKK